MNYFRAFSLLILLVFSGASSAQSELPPPDSESSSLTGCGVEMGRVIPADGSICKEDIAFGMLYEMFPSLFDTLLPFWRLTAFRDIGNTPESPDLDGEFYGDDVFFVLFELFYKMVLYCIALYVVVLILSVLIRWVRGESVTEKTPMKDNAYSWALGAGIGGSFLIPVKGFFVGQIVVFTLGVGALSMANFTYSVVLSGNQTLFGEGLEPSRVTTEATPEGTINRHHYLADLYYRYLTRMHLCRSESAAYQLSGVASSYASPDVLESSYKCARGIDDPLISSGWGVGEVGPFVWSGLSTQSNPINNKHIVRGMDKISFESRASNSLECRLEAQTALSYKCGSISINKPDWSRSELIELLDDPSVLYSSIRSLDERINPAMSAGALEAVVTSAWDDLRSDLEAALESAWRSHVSLKDEGEWVSVNNEVIRKEAALRRALLQDNRPLFMQASRMFHQEAMNSLMFGSDSSYRNIGGSNWDVISNSETNLRYHWEKTSSLADLVSRIQCVSNHPGLLESDLMLKFYKEELDSPPPEAIARCLDLDSQEVKEYNPDWDRVPAIELLPLILERSDELHQSLNEEWASSVAQLAEQRAAIELSFSESMQGDNRDSWWARLRKQGYLSAGDYAQIMNAEVNGYKRQVRLITNNFSADPMHYDSKYISEDLSFMFAVDSKFSPYSDGEMGLIGTMPSYNRIDPLVGSYHWVTTQEAIVRQPSLNLQGFQLSDLLSAWNTGGTYLDRLGIDLYQEGKSETACLEDPRMCPFPLSDPIVELSLMGHDMLDMAIQFYAVAIPMKVMGQMSPGQNHDGAIGGIISKVRSSMESNTLLSGASSMVGGTAKLMTHMVDFVYGALSGVMGMFMALGAALAYLLPLVPKIYLYMGFISWLMVLVMASFSILLLSLFWVRFHEKRDLIKTALLHYGIELAFKPTFNLMAVFFAAYFFYVVAFIVGGTLDLIWDLTSPGDNFLMPYIETLFVLLIITFIYILGLRYVYQLMDDLAGEILSRLGVQNQKVKDKVSDFIKAILFDAAQKKTTEIHDKLGNMGKKNPQEMEAKLKSLGQEIGAARKAQNDLRGSR